MTVTVIVLVLVHMFGCSSPNEENVKNEFTWNNISSIAKSGISSMMSKVMPSMLHIMSTANVSRNCSTSLTSYMVAIRKLDSWAVKMLDASSKIPSEILDGTLIDFGSFDECLDIRVKGNSRNSKRKELFRGRYCTVSFRSPLINQPWKKLSDGRNYTDVYGQPPEWVNETFVKAGTFLRALASFWIGICVPSACTKDDISSISTAREYIMTLFLTTNQVVGPYGINASVEDCQVDEPYVWELSTIAAICSLGCLGILCCVGTFLDVMERRWKSSHDFSLEDRPFARAIKAFSVLTNTEELFRGESRSGYLNCLFGIRFLSAVWIVLGHTIFCEMHLLKIIECRGIVRFVDEVKENLLVVTVENFTLGISTFFFTSGFLLVYTTWEQLKESDGRINVFMFCVHKYWRMTPGILLVMTLLFLMPATDSGPVWNTVLDPELGNCQKSWWRNLLFIQNWWNEDVCLSHTWYLAVLMQSHIVGILLVVVTYRWRVIGNCLGLFLMAGCVTVVASYVVLWNFPIPVLSRIDDYERAIDMLAKVYRRPFLHFPAYLMGMFGAFFTLEYRSTKLPVKYKTLGWIIAIFVGLLSVYGVHLSSYHVIYKAIYLSTSRIGWTLSIAWMTYACASGFGGIVNHILSFSALRPLGQISFLAYLIHYLVILYKVASARERVYIKNSVTVFSAFSTIFVTFAVAYIGFVTVEMPFAALKKIIFRIPEKKLDIKEDADK